MVRLACVNVADLPLQLLYRKHPEWREFPAAVVSRDSPYGRILTVNARAGEYGIESGQRYAGALSLNLELRADTIPEQRVAEGAEFLAGELRRFSPLVEPDRSEPGIYWLDAGGLSSLYPDWGAWCAELRRCLAESGFAASAAAGFTRFGCYAAAKSIQDQVVFPRPRSERAFALKAEISVLRFPPEVVERLEMLGVRSVGDFLELPPGAVGKRFGPEARRLHRFAAGELDLPLQPAGPQADPRWFIKLPYAEPSGDRLLDILRRSLEEAAGRLGKGHRLIRELRLCFVLDGAAEKALFVEPILPSLPTLDTALLADLIGLRMENLRLPAAVAGIRLSLATTAERNIQPELFIAASKESRREVDRVFARLRGLWGNSCIQRAVLEDEHIPELRYSWEDLGGMPVAGERQAVQEAEQARQAVRRIFSDPSQPPLRGFVMRGGPYPISAHWWRGQKLREYCYGETGSGEILWLCSDGPEGQWHQIGAVE